MQKGQELRETPEFSGQLDPGYVGGGGVGCFRCIRDMPTVVIYLYILIFPFISNESGVFSPEAGRNRIHHQSTLHSPIEYDMT